MKNSVTHYVLAGALLGVPLAARAQSPPPPTQTFMDGFAGGTPYVGLAGGYSLLQNIKVEPREGPLGAGPAQERWGNGFIGAGAAGWAFPNGLKIDVLGAYDYNNVNNLVPVPVPGKQTGHQESSGGFLEVLYGVTLPKFGIPITWMSPYLGVGAGALWTHVTLPEALSNGDLHHIGGTSGPNFAYEGIVGAAFPVSSVPGLAFTADYRLVGIHDAGDLTGTFYNRPAGVAVTGPIGLQKDIFVHLFTVGVAYAFNAAPAAPPPAVPPPPAAPPPAEARTYLVFFDWDRAELTARAREIVAQAAQASSHVQTTRIEVDGYADNSAAHPGPRGQRYNMALSLRRATGVKAELVHDGIAASAIDIHGFGEDHPLVPTGPDTREPQNRRVEIVLR
jgi:outer membrane protein OmpA-like peptidoglycan-associated protein